MGTNKEKMPSMNAFLDRLEAFLSEAPHDFRHIHTFGPEAIPALQWVRQACVFGNDVFADGADAVVTALDIKLNHDLRNWRGWTRRRHRLRQEAGRTVQ